MHIIKMEEEEVTGPILTTLHQDFLRKTIGMKSGQIEHLLKKRDELLIPKQQKIKQKSDLSGKSRDGKKETVEDIGQEPQLSPFHHKPEHKESYR